MKILLSILLFVSVLAKVKHSHSDICYRFDKPGCDGERSAYQFYTDKTGELLSSDFIIDQGENDNYGVSFYYRYTYSNCKEVGEGLECDRYCDSVWFRFLNLTGPMSKEIPHCDPIFQKKYANIMEHDCPGNPNIFLLSRAQIGKTLRIVVNMQYGVPTTPEEGYEQIKECVWQYHILGMNSIVLVTLSIIGSTLAMIVTVFLIIVSYMQKRKESRVSRLNNSLLRNQGGESNNFD